MVQVTMVIVSIFSRINQAAFGFGFIRFALEYKKTPARAKTVPAVTASQQARRKRKKRKCIN